MSKTALLLGLMFSFMAFGDDGKTSSQKPQDNTITCAMDLFGQYQECGGYMLGEICALTENGQVVWGSCEAAASSGNDIYCRCAYGD